MVSHVAAAALTMGAELLKYYSELATEVITENTVQNRVGSRVDVGQGCCEHVEHPGLVKPDRGERVIKEEYLMRGVAEEVDDDTGHQHLDHALPGSDSFVERSGRSVA